jgi:hypothetical protein
MRRSRKRVEQELGTNQMNEEMFTALIMYTLWYNVKLYRRSNITVNIVNNDPDIIDMEPVYCADTDGIIYVVKK